MLEDMIPVSLHTPGKDLEGHYVVQYHDGKNLLVEAVPGRAIVHDNSSYRRRIYQYRDGPSELGDVALAARKARPRRAFKLPDGVLVRRPRMNILVILACMLLTLMVMLPFLDRTNHLLTAGLILAFVLSFIPPLLLLPSADHAYEIDGEAIPLNELVPKGDAELSGTRIVDAVKEEYGALLGDVVYRIEHAALFDPAVESTRAFTEALSRWDDDGAALRPEQRHELAAQVRLSFDRARDHAETVGLNHLPIEAQPKARVAAQALRLAADSSTTDEEREAALRRANEILGSLTLYYLPRSAEVAELLGGEGPKALPSHREAPRP